LNFEAFVAVVFQVVFWVVMESQPRRPHLASLGSACHHSVQYLFIFVCPV